MKTLHIITLLCLALRIAAETGNRGMRTPEADAALESILSNISLDSLPTADTLYLYNADINAFLVGENRYKSQASLSAEHAYKVVLQRYLENDASPWDGLSYYITDSVEVGNFAGSFRKMFISEDLLLWVDYREEVGEEDAVWEIVPSGQKKHAWNIRPSRHNRTFTPDRLPNLWLGTTDNIQKRKTPLLSLEEKEYATDWYFVNRQQKDKILSLWRRQILQELTAEAKRLYPDLRTAETEALCYNMRASGESIEKAIGRLRLLTLNDGSERCDKEIDFTAYMVNADFSLPGGEGWQTAYDVQSGSLNWRGGDPVNYCAEAYQAVFDFSQTLKGMPEGLYRIDVNAFSRPRSQDMAWIERDSAVVSASIYANDMVLPVRNLSQMPLSDPSSFNMHSGVSPQSGIYTTMSGVYLPDDMKNTSRAFHCGYALNHIYCYADRGEITIGIKDMHKRTSSWTAWDNIRIHYLPLTAENCRKALGHHLAVAEDIAALAGVKKTDATALNAAIRKARHDADAHDTKTQLNALALLNGETEQARQRLIRQEFENISAADVALTSYQMQKRENSEFDRKLSHYHDSIKSMSDIGDAYFAMAEKIVNRNPVLAQQLFETAIDKWNEVIDNLEPAEETAVRELMRWSFRQMGAISYLHWKDNIEAEKSYHNSIEVGRHLLENALAANDDSKARLHSKMQARLLSELAFLQGVQKHYTEALSTIDRAISIDSDNPVYYDDKGELLFLAGDRKGAMDMWLKIQSLDSQYAQQQDAKTRKLLFGEQSK